MGDAAHLRARLAVRIEADHVLQFDEILPKRSSSFNQSKTRYNPVRLGETR